MVGFDNAGLVGNWGVACGYALPDQQSLCVLGTALSGFTVSGQLSIGDAVTNGSQAIVVIEGNVCVQGNGGQQCGTNTNKDAGLPGASLTFSQAYADAVGASSPSSSGFWDQPCDEVNGQWYVDLGA